VRLLVLSGEPTVEAEDWKMSKENKKCTNLIGKGLSVYGWLLMSMTPLWFLYESDEVGPLQITTALIVLILAISSWLLWAKPSQSRDKEVLIPLILILIPVGIISIVMTSLLPDLVLGVVAGFIVVSSGQDIVHSGRSG
jgi:uncharacterized membrane protein YfcA